MYGKFEQLKEKMLFKKIAKWDSQKLTLDDGIEITIECSDFDCCADAGGSFKEVQLDAVITDVVIVEDENGEWNENYATVTIYHNQNPIALAECYADSGGSGYYYSVCSLVVSNVHYQVVRI